jgi:flagellar P-ring protein FlgI
MTRSTASIFRISCLAALLPLLWAALCTDASAARLKELCEVQGARGNILKGVGIVVGLAGTGDGVTSARIAQERLLDRMDIDVEDLKELSSKNSAIVMVTATIPAFAKEGTRIDVKVDSIFDCESLEGGMLLETHLRGPGVSENVYAVAQGPVSVGGFNADATGGTRARRNHVTAGRIPMGAYVEREVPSTITDGSRIILLLKRPDFTTANAIQEAVNKAHGAGSALAMGAGTIRVTIPESERADLIAFIARLQELEVTTDTPARVVINERTGTIVVGGDVIIKPCQVAHGSLTIEISATPSVTPALPFTDAEAVITETMDLTVREEEAYLMPVEGTSAAEVAQALNRLRVTPRDMISIFQALREAGSLEADLEIM